MSTVVTLERDTHAAMQALLPWFVRGQLDDAEIAELKAHLLECPRCQAELAAERSLQVLRTLPLSGQVGSDVEAGLARMRARIFSSEGPTRLRSDQGSARPRWLVWTLGLQSGAIAALLLLLVLPSPEVPAYRALSAPGSAKAFEAMVIFKPGASEREIREALQAHGASLAGGPTESGAYVLRLASPGPQSALQGLRGEPVVILLEPLEAAPRR